LCLNLWLVSLAFQLFSCKSWKWELCTFLLNFWVARHIKCIRAGNFAFLWNPWSGIVLKIPSSEECDFHSFPCFSCIRFFWPLCCLSFDLRILIDYRFGIFKLFLKLTALQFLVSYFSFTVKMFGNSYFPTNLSLEFLFWSLLCLSFELCLLITV
jgi:hypothetical protein